MKSNITSFNTKSTDSTKQFFIPTLPHFLLNLLIGTLLLLLLSAKGLWEYFSSNLLQQTNLGSIISDNLPALHNLLSHISQGRALQVTFWILLGCGAYIIFWFIKNVLTNIRNDVVGDEYVHPKNYSRAGYWSSIILRKLFFVCTLLVFTAYIYMAARALLTLANLCYLSIVGFEPSRSPVVILVSILCTALLLHVFQILLRTVVHSWRFIYTDL